MKLPDSPQRNFNILCQSSSTYIKFVGSVVLSVLKVTTGSSMVVLEGPEARFASMVTISKLA
jgi:hypothetical protein